MPKNTAIILAGGKGVRLKSELPKQLIRIAGKKVIEHTLDVFQNHPEIDEIAVVSNIEYIRDIENLLTQNHYTKVKKVLAGGAERYDSSLAAIRAYQNEDCHLIFHDAVRPLVSPRIISDCIRALKTYNAVDVAIKTTDTIIEVEDRLIRNIPDRNRLNNGQTPQAFKIATIAKAYEIALKDPNFKATDDCGVVKKYLPDEKIFVVEGEGYNMKLTHQEDIFLLDKLFQLRAVEDSGELLTEKAKAGLKDKVIAVIGGSYGIGSHIVKMAEANGAKLYSFSRTENSTDVSDPEAVKNALKSVFEKERKIDFVINTSGILEKQSLENMDYDSIEQSVAVNYLGSVYVAKEALPYLKKTKGALLLFTSSSYTRGRSMYSIYSSTKAAIVNLVQALSEEWEDVRVNCINPERTRTPMRTKNFGNEPKGSLLSPERVAAASLNTLFSEFSGQVIDVKNDLK